MTRVRSLRGGTARGLGRGKACQRAPAGSLGSCVLEEAGLITHHRKENASMGVHGASQYEGVWKDLW